MSPAAVTFLSLNAVTATGAGVSRGIEGRNIISWSYEVTGGPTAISIQLEGRIGRAGTYRILSGPIATLGGDIVTGIDANVDEVRLNLVTLTGGTAPTVTGRINAQ